MNREKTLTFARTNRDFISTLNKRVNDYFKSQGIGMQGNLEMYVKTVCMFAIYFTPYVLILTGVVSSPLAVLASVLVMGVGLAGVGLSVMHDANHGAYSRKAWVNSLLGYSLNLIGSSAFNWKIQHNVMHHTFTNVHDFDEDIGSRGVLRLCPSTPWKKIHRFQFLYAWFLYSLMTIVWLAFKDFVRLHHYHKSDIAKKQKADIKREWLILIGTKLGYAGYMFLVPMLFTPWHWWQILAGITLMQMVAGFILAIIFQPAHVVEGTVYPVPDNSNSLENDWAVHQLLTTTNFGNRSRWFSWYAGGLNFQIEHHLFPNICHVHYKHIAATVRDTAREFGLPYKSFDTFVGALRGHARLLKELGKKPVYGIQGS